jgi:hypothetical protein
LLSLFRVSGYCSNTRSTNFLTLFSSDFVFIWSLPKCIDNG